jgi:hypothetical protein
MVSFFEREWRMDMGHNTNKDDKEVDVPVVG